MGVDTEQNCWGLIPQSTQRAGPVSFLIFCSISIILLASLVADGRPQCTVGAVQQGMYLHYVDLSTGISNLRQSAQAEVVLGPLSSYLASWVDTELTGIDTVLMEF